MAKNIEAMLLAKKLVSIVADKLLFSNILKYEQKRTILQILNFTIHLT